jgi:hypothetical protein
VIPPEWCREFRKAYANWALGIQLIQQENFEDGRAVERRPIASD